MNDLSIVIVMLLFSAFFSGMEIAFVSANKMKLEVDKQKNGLTSGILNIFTSNPQQYIATMLVGNNIALVIYGLAFANLLEPTFNKLFDSDSVVLLVQTISSTLLILFTAEFLPKMLFRLNPNGILLIMAVPVLFFYILLWPIARFSFSLSRWFISKILRKKISTDNGDMVFTRHDLDMFVNQSSDEKNVSNQDEETEIKLFKNALDFSRIKVRDCMIPRAEIEAVDENVSLDELRQKFVETGFSKILIYRDTIDDVYGYVHSSKLFDSPTSVKSMINTLTVVPETLLANKLLNTFIQKHKSIALVVDEFGGVSGIVTAEDILEEIFGEIEDEHDTDHLPFEQISDKEWRLSARFEIGYLNEKYGFDLPESEDYDTLAGLILDQHESIPKTNTIIETGGFRFKILKASRAKIEQVMMEKL